MQGLGVWGARVFRVEGAQGSWSWSRGFVKSRAEV